VRDPGSSSTTTAGRFPQERARSRNLAVQFHPELTAHALLGWLGLDGRELVEADGQDSEVLYQHTIAEGPAARQRAHDLVDAFLDQVAFPNG
jgi:hypothetical protein